MISPVGALEQVAARAGAQRGEDRVVVLEHGQDQDADVRAGPRAIARVASMPLSSGICRSIRITSGCERRRPGRSPRRRSAASPTICEVRHATPSSARRPVAEQGGGRRRSAGGSARRSRRRPGAAAAGRGRACRRPGGGLDLQVPPSSAARSRIERRPTPARARPAGRRRRRRPRGPARRRRASRTAQRAARRGVRRWSAPPARCGRRPPRPRPAAAAGLRRVDLTSSCQPRRSSRGTLAQRADQAELVERGRAQPVDQPADVGDRRLRLVAQLRAGGRRAPRVTRRAGARGVEPERQAASSGPGRRAGRGAAGGAPPRAP